MHLNKSLNRLKKLYPKSDPILNNNRTFQNKEKVVQKIVLKIFGSTEIKKEIQINNF